MSAIVKSSKKRTPAVWEESKDTREEMPRHQRIGEEGKKKIQKKQGKGSLKSSCPVGST